MDDLEKHESNKLKFGDSYYFEVLARERF